MPLTASDLLLLRTDITVTRAATLYQGQTLLAWWTSGADGILATFYNQEATPSIPLWRPLIPIQELVDATVGTEYIAGTAGTDVARRAWFDRATGAAFVDATKPQVRTNFATAAGAGSTTLTNWTALAKQNATYFEGLFITSTAGGASVTSQFGTRCSADDVSRARNA